METKLKRFNLEKAIAGERVLYLGNEGKYMFSLNSGLYRHVFKIEAYFTKEEYIQISDDEGNIKDFKNHPFKMAPKKTKLYIHLYKRKNSDESILFHSILTYSKLPNIDAVLDGLLYIHIQTIETEVED